MFYLQLGSTEWVEENRELLASRAVAYLNVDCAVSEPRFYASATPQLDELLIKATQQVSSQYYCQAYSCEQAFRITRIMFIDTFWISNSIVLLCYTIRKTENERISTFLVFFKFFY